VDVFDAADFDTATPTIQQLRTYDALLVFADNPFKDGNALGNVIADFFDEKGHVVLACFTNAAYGRLQGRWSSEGYDLITPASKISTPQTAAIHISDTSSPLVAGVSSLTAQAGYASSGSLAPGAIVVAKWGDNTTPLIVRGAKNGHRMVAINMYPPSSRADAGLWAGDGDAIMRNALMY
jgi:hypothetical protein